MMVEKKKDIVERLRIIPEVHIQASVENIPLGAAIRQFLIERQEAADEIERLRAKLKEAEEEYDLGEMARIAQEYNLDPIGDFLEWSRKRKT